MAEELGDLDDFEAFGKRIEALWSQRGSLAEALRARRPTEVDAALRNFSLAREVAGLTAEVRP